MRALQYSFIFLTVLSLLLTACKSAPQQNEAAPWPEIVFQEPEFTLASITILQADLINTRFKLSLKIDNPNAFPVTIASFRYELYGDGRFWASGVEKDLSIIPARESSQASFDCMMNFIGMRRQLLDDIIAMREVSYRIVGDMEIETGMASNPVFIMRFDYSGHSAVNK